MPLPVTVQRLGVSMRTPSLIAKLIAAALSVFSLAGCGKDEAPPKTVQETKSAQTVALRNSKTDRLAFQVLSESKPVEPIYVGRSQVAVTRTFTTKNEWKKILEQVDPILAGQNMALAGVYQFGSPKQISMVDGVAGFTVPETMREALSPPVKKGKGKQIRLVDADYASSQLNVIAVLRGSLDGLFRDHEPAFKKYCNGFADTKPGVCLRFEGFRPPANVMILSAVPN